MGWSKAQLKKQAEQPNKMTFWAHSKSDTVQIECLDMPWAYLHTIGLPIIINSNEIVTK